MLSCNKTSVRHFLILGRNENCIKPNMCYAYVILHDWSKHVCTLSKMKHKPLGLGYTSCSPTPVLGAGLRTISLLILPLIR